MSDGVDIILSLQTRLAIHRRTVAYLQEQRAQFGSLAPVHIRHQLHDTRDQIAKVKAELLALGAIVDDHPDDVELDRAGDVGTSNSAEAARAYRRTLANRLRYVSLDGLTEWRGQALKLAEVYVERNLAALTSNAPSGTLAEVTERPHARVLLEGEVGGGKSFALRRLALAYLGLALGDANDAALFSRPPERPLLPLLLEARDLVLPASPAHASLTQLGFWELIEHGLRRDGLGSALPVIEHALRTGDCLVLIDGLDDIVDNERGRALLGMLNRFVARYPDSHYVITCRQVKYLPAASLFGFEHYALPPLDDKAIDAFVAAYYPSVAPITTLAFHNVDQQSARLCGSIRANERLRALASNPLGAALCVLMHAQGYVLPTERGRVFARMIDLLLEGWEQLRSEGSVPTLAQSLGINRLLRGELRLALLEPLALAFQMRPDLSGDTPATMRYSEVEHWLSESLHTLGIAGPHASEQVIPRLLAWCCRQGLLAANTEASEYAMPWRCLREYLAAQALIHQSDFASKAYVLAGEPRWRETLLLAVRSLNSGLASDMVRDLLQLLLETPSGDIERLVSDTLMAAECLHEIEATRGPERFAVADVQARLQEMLRMPRVRVSERVRAGMVLGRLGDQRFSGLLPPLVRVPAGSFLFGTHEGYEDEGPQQLVDVPAFAIGAYPVTNAEYARFLAEAPDYPMPKYWFDEHYNNPSQPVVGITWHDAVAFCQWLTTRLHAEGVLPTTLVARLPLETEWEKAASWDPKGKYKRHYPWGDAWLEGAANTAEGRGAWVTAPVGCFPMGASSYGAHDMIGNVWEWTASEYASYPGALAPFYESNTYTLRGSSCASLSTHARCTYRSRLPASYWRYHLGFRIVLARPLPPAAPAQ